MRTAGRTPGQTSDEIAGTWDQVGIPDSYDGEARATSHSSTIFI